MSKKQKLILFAGVLLLGLTIVFFPKLKYFYAAFQKSSNTEAIVVYLKYDAQQGKPHDVHSVALLLQEKGVISETALFELVGNHKDMNARNIAMGKYVIEPGTAFRHIWNGFKLNSKLNGNAEQTVQVNFENCRTINDLAGKIQNQLDLDSSKLIGYLQEGSTLSRLGFTYEQLPALFIPNTYEMYWDQTPAGFVERMAQEFKNYWTPNRMALLQKQGLKTPSEAVTLASIVYSEQSKIADEWPIIAGLYLNRVRQGIKLQSDPTFKFCWGNQLEGVQRLLAVHRDIKCPYNTYQIQGLPPGPIYLPPTAVVEAVLNASKHDYIFMCAKPDHSSTHNFTASGAQHIQNATAFQRWLDAGQP
ncbi:MAG: endolytic transglycosylase MltG [Flavobacteriales bacterium]